MLPALRSGQLVIGWRPQRRLRPGQIVIINHQGLEKIKRITDIQGDRMFVQGDNVAASTDSRQFGMISTTAVLAILIWPR